MARCDQDQHAGARGGEFASGGVLDTWIDQSPSAVNAVKVGRHLASDMLDCRLWTGSELASDYMNYENRAVATGFAIFSS